MAERDDASTYGKPPADGPDERNEFQRAANGDLSPADPDPSLAAASEPSPVAGAGEDDGSVNNPGADPANEGGEGRPSPDVLDQMYDTLGAVTAGQQLRDQERDELVERLKQQEKVLIETRDAALEADDEQAFRAATSELEQLMQAWQVLDTSDDDDEEPADAGTDQHQDRAGQQPADELGRDGDADPGVAG